MAMNLFPGLLQGGLFGGTAQSFDQDAIIRLLEQALGISLRPGLGSGAGLPGRSPQLQPVTGVGAEPIINVLQGGLSPYVGRVGGSPNLDASNLRPGTVIQDPLADILALHNRRMTQAQTALPARPTTPSFAPVEEQPLYEVKPTGGDNLRRDAQPRPTVLDPRRLGRSY